MLTLHEENIKTIIVDDLASAYTVYEKESIDDTLYKVSYHYHDSYISPNETYCEFCGSFYDKTESICPNCREESQDYIYMGDIKELIIDALANKCQVRISMFDGKVETLQL